MSSPTRRKITESSEDRPAREGNGVAATVGPPADTAPSGEGEAVLRTAVQDSLDQQRRLHLALAAGQMGTWEFNPDSGFVRWSPTLEAIHGVPEGSFSGTFEAFLRDVHLDDLPRVRRSIERTLKERGRHDLQYRIVRPDGEVRWLEAHGRFEVDADGKPGRLVGVCADITDRKALEADRDAATQRNRRLLSITGAIADAVTPAQVHEAVVDQVSGALGASSAGLWLVDRGQRVAALVRSRGYREVAKATMRSLDLESELRIPVLDAMRSGRPIWIDSQEALVEAYPHLAPIVSPGRNYRVACLPIMSQGTVLGGLAFTFEGAPRLNPDERAFIVLVASYCVQALERLRLLETERESRTRAEAAATRLGLLSRASRHFAEASPGLPDLLDTVVGEIISDYADASGILLAPGAGDVLEVVSVRHRQADGTALIRTLLEATPPRIDEGLAGRVIQTGESILISDVHPSLFAAEEYAPFREFIGRFPPESVVIVPLRTAEQPMGALCAIRTAGQPSFEEADREVLQELADRATMAIERSRLHQSESDARDRAELLYRLAAGVIGADRLEQLFETALDGLQSALGAERSSILSTDPDGSMKFRAWRNLSDAYRAAVEGHSPWRPDAPEPGPVLVENVESDPELSGLLPVLRSEAIGAVAFFPLLAGRDLIGKCVVYFRQPRELEAHELAMAQAIADHVAAAIGRFAAIAELRQTVHFNEMFTGMLGHDLRNPLGSIMTAAQLAVLRSSEERLTVPLTRILKAGARMARMIDQLLDFTRVRVGAGIPLDTGPANVATILREVMDELDDAHPEWTLRLERSGDTRGIWDSDRLSQVFSNLVANAVQHGIPEHGATVRIDGTAPDSVSVEVHNQGTIPADQLPDIFEAMSEGERSRARSGGLGLGLFITRQILRSHGGNITVASSDLEGTTFTVHLPRQHAPDRES